MAGGKSTAREMAVGSFQVGKASTGADTPGEAKKAPVNTFLLTTDVVFISV